MMNVFDTALVARMNRELYDGRDRKVGSPGVPKGRF